MTRGTGGRSPINVTRHLRGIDFPARKKDLIQQAREDDADDAIIRQLERMPDQEYQDMADVMAAYGQTDEEESNE
ncbi:MULTISPECIES: DUF2795 domain-containing protein [Nannocystis]|uniref:DUF2795 domain-containing protein n=1 Tax=Nannocystis radixulma TaxID=2995305 RepID=A0ABT5BCQ9_9BACT|nr:MULTISPECIES: DUF2795 domain-containing protein [Nannocystis]MCY1059022.1 DUF2795 domain-containing protein [Nannocystis sp. SCPEA4]MDC0671929.1 DUF2795 domain-containing protein [Nannocystis radixulma]